MKYNKGQKTKKFAAVILAFAFMSGSAFAQSQPPLPPQNQPGQNAGPVSPDQNQPGQHQPGQHKPGQNQPGQNQPGQNQPGQNQPVQHQAGQNQPVQHQPGQQQWQSQPGQNQPLQHQPGQQYKPGQPQPGQQWQKNQPGDQWQQPGKNGFRIQEMLYKPGGRLQIRLDNNDIRWNKNERIIVRDSHNRIYNARISRTDRNMVEFIIAGLLYGESYSIEIPGVHYRDMDYTLRGDFWARDNWRYDQYSQRNLIIQEIWYKGDGRLRIRLYNPNDNYINWNKNVRVIVRDSRGRYYNAKIRRVTQETIELKIQGLRYGQRYTIEIPGVRYNGRDHIIEDIFWAKDNWRYKR